MRHKVGVLVLATMLLLAVSGTSADERHRNYVSQGSQQRSRQPNFQQPRFQQPRFQQNKFQQPKYQQHPVPHPDFTQQPNFQQRNIESPNLRSAQFRSADADRPRQHSECEQDKCRRYKFFSLAKRPSSVSRRLLDNIRGPERAHSRCVWKHLLLSLCIHRRSSSLLRWPNGRRLSARLDAGSDPGRSNGICLCRLLPVGMNEIVIFSGNTTTATAPDYIRQVPARRSVGGSGRSASAANFVAGGSREMASAGPGIDPCA